MKKDYDYLIVGAGLFGSTFAWHARQAGKRCLVIDRRPHTGGGVHDRLIEGINVHEYGPHIFHTSDEGVWRLACRFVRFNRFRLHVKANYKGRIYSLPFNLNTFREMWGTATPEEARRTPVTVLTREYPAAYVPGGEAYYPVNDERNDKLYARYKALAGRETDVVFGGRLAEYRYYDMDRTMRSAMDAWERECRRKI